MTFAVPTVDTRTPIDKLRIEEKNRDIGGFDDFTIRDLISPVQWPAVVVSAAIQGQFTVAGEHAIGLRIRCQGSRYAQLCVSLSGMGRGLRRWSNPSIAGLCATPWVPTRKTRAGCRSSARSLLCFPELPGFPRGGGVTKEEREQ